MLRTLSGVSLRPLVAKLVTRVHVVPAPKALISVMSIEVVRLPRLLPGGKGRRGAMLNRVGCNEFKRDVLQDDADGRADCRYESSETKRKP